MAEPLKFSKENGRPCMPLQVNGGNPFTNILNANQLRRFPVAHGQNDTRLRIFSGTANPALSQVLILYSGFLFKELLFVSNTYTL